MDSQAIPNCNPLKIAVIIQTIFTFLRFIDVLECRLVCKEWKHEGELYLRRRCNIKIRQNLLVQTSHPFIWPSFTSILREDIYKRFTDVFCEADNWTRFRFENNNVQWPISCITTFFEKVRCVTSLSLLDVIFYEDNETRSGRINMNTWLTTLNNNGSHLNELYLKSNRSTTKYVIDMQFLAKLDTIYLNNVRILLSPNVMPSPTRLYLQYTEFYLDNTRVYICINDYFNLEKIQFLNLQFPVVWDDDTLIELNVGMGYNFVNVFLKGVLLVDLKNSKCKIRSLTLLNSSFMEMSTLSFKSLCFIAHQKKFIELTYLPKCLTKLSLIEIGEDGTTMMNNSDINLENLKYLYLSSTSGLTCLRLFQNCKQLTDLELCCLTTVGDTLDLGLLPLSIKILKLKEVYIDKKASFQYFEEIKLERLILVDYSLAGVHLYNEFPTNEMVVKSEWNMLLYIRPEHITPKFIESISFFTLHAKRVYINAVNLYTGKYFVNRNGKEIKNRGRTCFFVKTRKETVVITENVFRYAFKTYGD